MDIWVISIWGLWCMLWTLVYKFWGRQAFSFLGHIWKRRITGSDGNSLFSLLKNCQTVFSSRRWIRVPVSPYSLQHLLLPAAWIISFLVGVKWSLILVFICISLMADDVEHSFMCWWTILISSLQLCLFRSSILGFFFYLGCLFIDAS